MLAVLTEPIDISIVDDGGCALADWGPIIGAAALILVGLLAYYGARKNHQEQLDHDRAMHNRDATRDTVDEVVEASGPILESLADLGALVDTVDSDRAEGLEIDAEAQELVANARRGLIRGHLAHTRLGLRFPRGHAVPELYSAWLTIEERWVDAIAESLPAPRSAQEQEDAKKLETEAGSAFDRFLDACREWFIETDKASKHRAG